MNKNVMAGNRLVRTLFSGWKWNAVWKPNLFPNNVIPYFRDGVSCASFPSIP
jgi:hypothetical protein